MQKLSSFVFEAGRGRPRKNPENTENSENVKLDIDVIDPSKLTPKDRAVIAKKAAAAERKKGKDAKKNGTHGNWAVEPPYDDGAVEKISKEDMNMNLKRLKAKFVANEPFFIQGRAGWGKTSIIKDMAKRYGRHIITVYLDKAVASDLGGIPVPVEGKKGTAKIVNAMPEWAAYMLENDDKEFLLFFDEMNQAAPDVMNTLMPIVLENVICNIQFDNFMVGAAGNLEEENRQGVNKLSGPLESRFKPIIKWEIDWKAAMKHLVKKYKDELPQEVLDVFAEIPDIFVNPRELEHKVFKWMIRVKAAGEEAVEDFDAEYYFDQLERTAKENLSQTEHKQLVKMADMMYNYLNRWEDYTAEKSANDRKNTKTVKLDEKTRTYWENNVKKAMQSGNLKGTGISRENIIAVFTDPEITAGQQIFNAEMLERLISKFEIDDIKFKYETDEEWKKAGLEDPLE